MACLFIRQIFSGKTDGIRDGIKQKQVLEFSCKKILKYYFLIFRKYLFLIFKENPYQSTGASLNVELPRK